MWTLFESVDEKELKLMVFRIFLLILTSLIVTEMGEMQWHNCRKVEEDLSKELNLEIKGAEKPCLWNLMGVQFVLLPYASAKVRHLDDFRTWSETTIYNYDLLKNLALLLHWQLFVHSVALLVWMLVLEVPSEKGSILLGRCCLLDTKNS